MGDVQVLRAGLASLAARFVLPGLGPDVDQAITLACELLACGLDTPATADVAAMRYGTPLRDAGPLLREMLDEQGCPAPGPGEGQDGNSARCCVRWPWGALRWVSSVSSCSIICRRGMSKTSSTGASRPCSRTGSSRPRHKPGPRLPRRCARPRGKQSAGPGDPGARPPPRPHAYTIAAGQPQPLSVTGTPGNRVPYRRVSLWRGGP